MELPSRAKNDRYTRPGQYQELASQLRSNPANADISTLVCYAFDHRTRLGPFLFLDKSLLPAGPRAVSAALAHAGFTRQRIVMRQWNPNFRPSEARLDGAVPEMLFVSSMQIHSASAYEMIADAHRLGADRPFIVAGGAKAIYEPWDFFGFGPDGRWSADVVCTGEEYVILELLNRLGEYRGRGEHMRKTFHRLRRSGLLDDIPGLVFLGHEWSEDQPLGGAREMGQEKLINTGIQRMVQNLDELPHPMVSLGLIEPKHNRRGLSSKPIPAHKLSRYARILSLVTTHGCKFHCPYCPIPAYNQFTFRFKSPERLRDEMKDILEQTGISTLFGTDDNFFNNRETVQETFEVLAKSKARGKPFRDVMFFGTEATEFDVFKNQDLLPMCRDGGLRAIWFGIEDMTAELVKKGQSPEKTEKLFKILKDIGICPMAMMMHHDGQPLYSKNQLYGLLNQVNFLRKSGSVSVQVTILTPSVGSKGYEEPYETGMVIEQAGAHKVEDYQYDGNHCIATHDPHPWRKQMNIYLAYASFYNPLNFVKALVRWKDPLWDARVLWQVYGMAGVVKSFMQGWGWMKSLMQGPVKKMTELPRRRLEMVAAETGPKTPALQQQPA
jgi:radical SAM superfamily enzyme YgiQ (UPF0313 family)